MRVRYTINERGELADRDGNVLGRLTSLTLEQDPANSGQRVGTIGVGVDLQGQQQGQEQNPRSPLSIEDAAIAEVYDYWRSKRPTAREAIPAGTRRQLKRALKAGYTVEQQKAMIDALLASEWHQNTPGSMALSTIFATKPGGKTFEDQLDYWLERSSSPSPGNAESSYAQQQIASAKENLRYLPLSDLERRRELENYLNENGVRTVWKTDKHGFEYPTFEEAS